MTGRILEPLLDNIQINIELIKIDDNRVCRDKCIANIEEVLNIIKHNLSPEKPIEKLMP